MLAGASPLPRSLDLSCVQRAAAAVGVVYYRGGGLRSPLLAFSATARLRCGWKLRTKRTGELERMKGPGKGKHERLGRRDLPSPNSISHFPMGKILYLDERSIFCRFRPSPPLLFWPPSDPGENEARREQRRRRRLRNTCAVKFQRGGCDIATKSD